MADIVSAKCFGCGHVVKVPAALGGKKAKCPQCAQVIVIPAQADHGGEFMSDDMLPEVARDEDVLQGLPVEEDEVLEGEVVEQTPSGSRLRSMTPRRGTPTGAGGRGGRARGGTGVYAKAPAHGGYAAPRKSSAAPVIIGVVLAIGAIVAVLAIFLTRGPAGGGSGRGPEKPPEPPPPQITEADVALQRRCMEYIQAFNRGNLIEIMKFHSYSPNEEIKLKASISSMLEAGTRYEDVGFKTSRAESGEVTFVHSKGERTIHWTLVDGVWLISGGP